LELTRKLLHGLGLGSAEVKRLVDTFKRQDERRLYQDYQYYTDLEKVTANAKSQAKELEDLFARDVEEIPAEGDSVSGERRDGRAAAG
jgi:hypothetical protein